MNKLYYDRPAENWLEALPIGNGRIGAMVFSSINDVITLNEDTLWSGYPKDPNRDVAESFKEIRKLVLENNYAEAEKVFEAKMAGEYTQSYMPLGEINLNFHLSENRVTNFSRYLNLEEAIVYSSFEHEGTQYKKETFVSQPDQIMVMKISASKPSEKLTINIGSQLKSTVNMERNLLILDGICPSHAEPSYRLNDIKKPMYYLEEDAKKGISFRAIVDVICDGKKVDFSSQNEINNWQEIIIRFSVRTSYNDFDKLPFLEGREFKIKASNDIEMTKEKSYESLKNSHIEDFSELFNRVDLQINSDDFKDVSLENRLKDFQDGRDDFGLYVLIFQYGRYLTISGSRPGTEPLNLQGIWNKELFAPWSSNYTININAQMNYWPVEMCNLSELHEPLFTLIRKLKETGKLTAKQYYNARGFVGHHNSDLWGLSNPVGQDANNSTMWAFWNMGAAWLCQHLFEHYEYTLDKDFLGNEAYPLMKEAALYCLDLLTRMEDGSLAIVPATSPENRFLVNGEKFALAKTATMSNSIAKELFLNCIKSSGILGIDHDFSEELQQKLDEMTPYKIGNKGQLLEFDEDFEEPEPHHRHQSHLYALYPGSEINLEQTRDLALASKRSLELRGEEGTGWSLGWKINLWARLNDGEAAYKLLRNQLMLVDPNGGKSARGGTYPNLFDAHPPFQIDGNFATTAGIAQMYMQSYAGKIFILPALPTRFVDGHIKGLRAKNGVEIDIYFKNNQLSHVQVKAVANEKVNVRLVYNHRELEVALNINEIKLLEFKDFAV